jgi:hypothetical protein
MDVILGSHTCQVRRASNWEFIENSLCAPDRCARETEQKWN